MASTTSDTPADFTSAPRWLDAPAAAAFARETLLSSSRTWPVVALTVKSGAEEPLITPADLVHALGGAAEVVVLHTGDATWALTDELPQRLDVYGGAARIWWPGLDEASDPYDHPLMLIHSRGEADSVLHRIVDAVRAFDGRRVPTGRQAAAPRDPAPEPMRQPMGAPELQAAAGHPSTDVIREGTVVWQEGAKVLVDIGSELGLLVDVELVAGLAEVIRPGAALAVRRADEPPGFRRLADSVMAAARPSLTHLGALAAPQPYTIVGPVVDPWRVIGQAYRVGDVVRGRVHLVRRGGVHVSLLPGASIFVPLREVDATYVHDAAELYSPGDEVHVKVLELDLAARTGLGSIRQALGSSGLREAIALLPGLRPFLGPADAGDRAHWLAQIDRTPQLLARIELVEGELRSALESRAEARQRMKETEQRLVALRKDLRSVEDQLKAVEAQAFQPTRSENDFLGAVRVEYARTVTEGDRRDHPLLPMRVGAEFTDRLRALEGIDIAKVIEVCAQVASHRAHRIAGREVHELRTSDTGGAGRVRARDGAKAMRCALQVHTPGARRLHWWDIPGPDGREIEFASVGVHDDVSIPE